MIKVTLNVLFIKIEIEISKKAIKKAFRKLADFLKRKTKK